MNQKVESIQLFAKKLIKVDSSASIKEAYTLMLSEEVSYLPIIDHGGKKNVGVYKRKVLFEWLVRNPGKNIDEVPKEEFRQKKLPKVDMQTSLKETMRILHSNSAILIKDQGVYTHLITPRVVANALEEYSARFMIFESLEKEIRNKIFENKIDLLALNDSKLNKPFPAKPDKLDFSQYITVFSKKWDDMGLNHLNKKTIIALLVNAASYRNALMHFRLNDTIEGFEDARKLLRLLR